MCWSDCADAQADLRLCCSYMAKQVFSRRGSNAYPRKHTGKNRKTGTRFKCGEIWRTCRDLWLTSLSSNPTSDHSWPLTSVQGGLRQGRYQHVAKESSALTPTSDHSWPLVTGRANKWPVQINQRRNWCWFLKITLSSDDLLILFIYLFFFFSINPHKPGGPFVGHRQTVQTQIRRHRTRRLISVYTVCAQKFLSKIW